MFRYSFVTPGNVGDSSKKNDPEMNTDASNLQVVLKDFFFFLSRFSFTDTDNSQDSRGREGTFLYSTLPLPPVHEHSDIYVQPCT